MSLDPIQTALAALERGGFEPRPTGRDSSESRCPGHDGEGRSLSISRGDDGRALLHCFAHDCVPEAIVAALGLTMSDLFPDRNGTATRPKGKPASNGRPKKAPRLFDSPEAALAALHLGKRSAVWAYRDADGTEAFRVARFDGPAGKSFRPIHPIGRGWAIGDPPGPLPLYRLNELADAKRVYLCEGEKAADAVCNLGAVATTSAHGSGAAHKTDWRPLSGLEVVILPDHDESGEKYAREVIALLSRLDDKPTVRVVRLPITNDGDDVVEWLRDKVPDSWDDVQCRAELDRLADAAPVEDLGAVADETEAEADGPDPARDWPALALGTKPPVERFPVDALPGPVAEFVGTVADAIGCPEDFVGLPVLVTAGAAIGRSISLILKHGYSVSAALYAANVGGPSSGKSPAQEAVVRPFWDIDEAYHERFRVERDDFNRALEIFDATPKGQPKPPRPVKPILESAVVENATVESLAPLLAINSRGLLLRADELSAWVDALNQYKAGGKGSDRQFFLSALFGKTIRVDRRGHPELEPIRVPDPFLSVIGGIQPEMLTALREARGRSDGFIERLLFAIPDPRPRPSLYYTSHKTVHYSKLREKSRRVRSETHLT